MSQDNGIGRRCFLKRCAFAGAGLTVAAKGVPALPGTKVSQRCDWSRLHRGWDSRTLSLTDGPSGSQYRNQGYQRPLRW